jgi:endogenous inhibitor of DNA gyrase (YacG/DUF329 family)
MVNNICRQCGQTFERRKTQAFCSMTCRAESQKVPTRNCPTCGTPFWVRGRMSGRTYCSKACADKGQVLPPKACEWCHKEYQPDASRSRFCSRTCSARFCGSRRPGLMRNRAGYILEWSPDHPNAMRSGYVMQHRKIMAEVMRRPLTADEVVDHINGVKDDNRPENLRVLAKLDHDSLPKPPRKPIECPHCHAVLMLSGRARSVVVLSPPGADRV